MAQPESIAAADAVPVLKQLADLVSWAQAQQALIVHRIETELRRDMEEKLGTVDGSVALSAAAAEVGSALNLPHMSALALVSESDTLCTLNRSTHAQLSRGAISYRHAQRIMDEVQAVPAHEAPIFEDELLRLAEGRTCAQFTAKARRLRESRWPETIAVRHRQALELRRVSLDPKPDGMMELCALVAAEKGQAIFNSLTASARTARSAGDQRTLDQLRTDTLTALLLRVPQFAGSSPASSFTPWSSESAAATVPSPPRAEDPRGIRAEIMVLIDAETLLGADDKPAELNGYGPIAAEAARRLARQAVHWTGILRDNSSGEILAVGRRRKVPAGLRRWLQARDGTCRFPGCRVSTFRTEIDHTVPWVRGGATEHGNLSNLCPKHHRLKTLGLWEARQHQPGKLEWISPLGHAYSTAAQLDFGQARKTVAPASESAIPRHRLKIPRPPSPSEDERPPPF
ncbi:DUF222 domain-containing protein [Arthrobacter gandavensis]|uniref:HNH endonuclease signature motif containing protein n=1 Tax=Arthrobacter gandavensis TaxID=169960 RepID=UPI00188FC608|nr:HNH endonuclease signature motif containing protein [Arthrobacter gandavensis]MBF4992628.1 DUF222 domain-containing protein [Arthrobacter gandavensis]